MQGIGVVHENSDLGNMSLVVSSLLARGFSQFHTFDPYISVFCIYLEETDARRPHPIKVLLFAFAASPASPLAFILDIVLSLDDSSLSYSFNHVCFSRWCLQSGFSRSLSSQDAEIALSTPSRPKVDLILFFDSSNSICYLILYIC